VLGAFWYRPSILRVLLEQYDVTNVVRALLAYDVICRVSIVKWRRSIASRKHLLFPTPNYETHCVKITNSSSCRITEHFCRDIGQFHSHATLRSTSDTASRTLIGSWTDSLMLRRDQTLETLKWKVGEIETD